MTDDPWWVPPEVDGEDLPVVMPLSSTVFPTDPPAED